MPIITALASFGMSGQLFHAPFIQLNSNYELRYIVERTKNLSAEIYPSAIIVRSFEELVTLNDIDLIVINSPTELHFYMAQLALLAGKHVVVEKPFTCTVLEAEVLIRIAKEKNLVLSVYHNKRLESDYLTAKRILDSKVLGTITECEWHFDRYRTHISHKKWKEEDRPGAGVLFDLGVHLIDSCLQLFGWPTEVTAHTRIIRNGAMSPDYFMIYMTYPSMSVILKSSTICKEKGPQLALHGDKGSYLKYFADVQEAQLLIGKLPTDFDWGIEPKENSGIIHYLADSGDWVRENLVSEKGAYENFYQNLARHITQNEPSLMISPIEALNTIKIIAACYQSVYTKSTVVMADFE